MVFGSSRCVKILLVPGILFAALAAPPARADALLPWTPGSWTLVVLPDTQRYTDTRWDPDLKIFRSITQWIADNKDARNIRFVLHEGDITSGNTASVIPPNTVAAWQVASEAMAVLDEAGVPYSLTTGNHDHDQWKPSYRTAPTRETFLNDYFPVSRYKSMPTFGGVFEPGRTENNYHLFSAGGKDYITVSLEFGPRNEVVAWAADVLSQHPDRIALIVTHAYTYSDGTRYDWAAKRGRQKINPHGSDFDVSAPHDGTENVNDGEQLWQKLVSKQANVRMVFSGHLPWAGARQTSVGEHGQKVHEMLAAYHDPPEGYLRLLEFLPDGRTVQVRTYSPYLDKYLTDDAQQFMLHVDPVPERPKTGPPAAGGLSGARIADGNHTIDANGGVLVGTYKISIEAYRIDPKYRSVANSPPPVYHEGPWPPRQQYLPKKFNAETTLEITVASGSGKMTRDFDLAD